MASKKKSAKKAATKKTIPKAPLDIQLSASLIEVIAACVANGAVGAPLHVVIRQAEARAAHVAWRKQLDKMLEGSGVL